MPKSKTVEIKMNQLDIETYIISGIKLKFLSTVKNDYGKTNLFQVLDEKTASIYIYIYPS